MLLNVPGNCNLEEFSRCFFYVLKSSCKFASIIICFIYHMIYYSNTMAVLFSLLFINYYAMCISLLIIFSLLDIIITISWDKIPINPSKV